MIEPVRTVLVVDDDEQVREPLSRHLTGNPGIAAVFEAANGAAAVAVTEEHRPTAIVLDPALPDARGSELIPALRPASPGVRVVACSADPHGAAEAAPCGADGFVAKGSSLAEHDRLPIAH